QLTVNAATQLVTSAARSTLNVQAGQVLIAGTVYAGARTDRGAVVPQADGGLVNISATDTLHLGVASGEHGADLSRGANIGSTGNITLQGGRGTSQNGLGLVVDSNSTVQVENIGGVTSGTITLSGAQDLRIDGFVKAALQGGQVFVQARHLASIAGMVEGYSLVDIAGGLGDSTGVSVSTTQVQYRMDGTRTYFLDENSRLMDGQGWLRNAGGDYVDAAGAVVGASGKVMGGAPQRLTGAILDTGTGGRIHISGTGTLNLDGNLGQVYQTSPGVLGVRTQEIDIDGAATAQTHVLGAVNAQTRMAIEGGAIDLREGSSLRTWGDGGQIEVTANANLLVSGGTAAVPTAAKVQSTDWVHLRGNNVYMAGSVTAQNIVWLNAASDLMVYGQVQTLGTGLDGAAINVRAGVDATLSNTAARGTVNRMDLGQGSIYLLGQGSLQTGGQLNAQAGVDVVLTAEAAQAAGLKAVQTPIIGTETVTYQVITGYNQVVDKVIEVPVVKWVSTTVTEQVGMESVKTGYAFHTMDVTLNQDAYWNGTTQTKREFFIEGVDYRNSATTTDTGSGHVMTPAEWAATGATRPSLLSNGREPTFNDLIDVQRDAVLKALGYMKLYNMAYSNLQVHQVINGNTTVAAWAPDWSLPAPTGTSKAMQIVNLKVAGWDDKWINMPVGAEADVLRVVSQGVASQSFETVGTYNEQAIVTYTQDKSGRTQSTAVGYEPLAGYFPGLGGITIPTNPMVTNTDIDHSALRWSVDYNNANTSNWIYTLNDGTINVAKPQAPSWAGGTPLVVANDKAGNYALTPQGYNDLTASVSGSLGTIASIRQLVGTNYDYVPVHYVFHAGQYSYWYDLSSRTDFAQPTNAAQNAAVAAVVPSGSGLDQVWIGIRRSTPTPESSRPTGSWVYETTGGQIAYSNWASGEPNSLDHEWVAAMWLSPGKRGQWNDADDNASGYDANKGYVTVDGGYWNSASVFENFLTQNRQWTSVNHNVTDARSSLSYQWVGNSADVFDNRPQFRNYDTQTKVVESASVTLYKDQAIVQDQTTTRSTRLYDSNGHATYADFGVQSINAGSLGIDAGRDIRLTGLVQTAGDAVLVAGRDVSVVGQTVSTATLAAVTDLEISGRIRVDAGRDVLFDSASVLHSGQDAGATTAARSGGLDVTARTGAVVVQGVVTVSGGGAASLTAANDLNASTQLRASNITLSAGSDGSGSLVGDVSTDLQAIGTGPGAGQITLTAGANGGNIVFDNSGVSAAGMLRLNAAGGSLYAKGVALQARDLQLTAAGQITGDAANSTGFVFSAATLSAQGTAQGLVNLAAQGDVIATDLRTTDGSITLAGSRQVTVQHVVTGGNQHLSLSTSAGQDLLIGLLEAGTGTLTLLADGTVQQLAGSGLVAGLLDLQTRQGVRLIGVDAGTLRAAVSAAGDLALASVRSGSIVLDKLGTRDGAIDVTALGDVQVQDVTAGRTGSRMVAPAAGDSLDLSAQPLDISLTSGGAITGLGTGVNLRVNAPVLTAADGRKAVAGGALALSAVNGIGGLTTDVSELRAIATVHGNIAISNQSDLDTGRNLLQLTQIEAAAGDITLVSNSALDVRNTRAVGADKTLTLQSTQRDVLVGAGANLFAGVDTAVGASGSIVLKAAGQLGIDASVWVDAPTAVTFYSGHSFVLPTRAQGYDAASLTVESGESITVTSDLLINRLNATDDRVVLRSARDITLSGAISRA
ncbi:hypothetical protein, partial [Sphaerotilus sp.]|uniref:hypothetical protein n=1 Tax=Sphaerotilus sp. TaxID=2093942 RepID=UPI0034E1BFAD